MSMKNILSADQIVRLGTTYVSNFFSKGWGSVELLHRLARFQESVLEERKLDAMYELFERTPIDLVNISEDEKSQKSNKKPTKLPTYETYQGSFVSPLTKLVPNALPAKSEKVNFELVLPTGVESPAVCIHLAGTGDHTYWWRKKNLAIPLAENNKIASIILENPFYGQRKPKNQVRSSVNYVSDIFTMGSALVVECATLFKWCQRQNYGKLGITGISMGGHMATVAASGWRGPLAVVPCLSWTSAGPIYTEGVLHGGVHWKILEKQLHENPEYYSLIRKDDEFKQLLKNHYINKSCTELHDKLDTSSFTQNNVDKNKTTPPTTSRDSSSNPDNYFVNKLLPISIDIKKYIVDPIQTRIVDPFSEPISELFSSPSPSKDTLNYMTVLMDQATHLAHFNRIHRDSSVIYVVGDHDKYINREFYNVTPQDIWPQTEVRTIDCGHVVGCMMHNNIFCEAIADAFEKLPSTAS